MDAFPIRQSRFTSATTAGNRIATPADTHPRTRSSELYVLSTIAKIPGVTSAAKYVGTKAAAATTSFAAGRSETAKQVVDTVGKGASTVSTVAAGTLVGLEKGTALAAKPVSWVLAPTLGISTAVVTGAAYALSAVSGPTALLITAAATALGWFGPKVLMQKTMRLTVGDHVDTVKGVADSVADVCKTPEPTISIVGTAIGAPAMLIEAKKDRPAA